MRRPRDFRSKLPDSPLTNALLYYRETRSLSVKQMAHELGLAHVTLLRLLHSGKAATIQVYKQLARFFEWTPGELGMVMMWEPPPKKKRAKRDQAEEG